MGTSTAKTIVDLTPDQTDAVLRDPNVPPDVRATVAANYNVARYLEGVEFYAAEDGYTETRPRSVDSTADEVTPDAVTPDVPAADPAPVTDTGATPTEAPPAGEGA
jgi:hypothetical protein